MTSNTDPSVTNPAGLYSVISLFWVLSLLGFVGYLDDKGGPTSFGDLIALASLLFLLILPSINAQRFWEGHADRVSIVIDVLGIIFFALFLIGIYISHTHHSYLGL